MMKNREGKFLSLTILFWIGIVGGLAWWNIAQIKQADHGRNLEAARSLFDTIVTAREWNARLGGVYVPISDSILPNPYLNIPDRDITSTTGIKLTVVNPAFMTRLIGEIAEENNNVAYHITSLKPIRLANAPNSWEKAALIQFEEDTKYEVFEWNEQTQKFRYMAPLYTQESCLQCHEKQGYQIGDVRGGITVSFPGQPVVIWPTLLSYLAVGGFGLLLIAVFGIQLTDSFNELEEQTEIDGLTQINNRYYFDNHFHREYLRARRINSPLSIVIGDIDDFKAFNDAYGHQAGDNCLKSVAQALQDALHRPGDLVARYGGEEFGILLPDTTPEGAYALVEVLRARIEALNISHQSNRASKYVTISFGVATFTGKESSLEKLLERADRALYQAKARGRNLVVADKLSVANDTSSLANIV